MIVALCRLLCFSFVPSSRLGKSRNDAIRSMFNVYEYRACIVLLTTSSGVAPYVIEASCEHCLVAPICSTCYIDPSTC